MEMISGEVAVSKANQCIGLLRQWLGPVQDAEDPRVIIMNGQQGYVSGFIFEKMLFMKKITVNFYELPRNKLFQYDNAAIIGKQYRPSFVHFYLQHVQELCERYNLSGNPQHFETDESPWDWAKNYENSQFDE